MNHGHTDIKGTRENNLKNIDVRIPRDKLAIMTGVPGPGKTSLTFNTVCAEGQRRHVKSLSAYTRQFLGNSEKPDVDSIKGLSPSTFIDQKTASSNPYPTVGMVMEIYDYLRPLYARAGIPYCLTHNESITSQTIKQMVDRIMEIEDKTCLTILFPIEYGRRGTHRGLFKHLCREGYIRVCVDGEMEFLEDAESLEKNKGHNIDVVIDRTVKGNDRSHPYDSLETAPKPSDGLAVATCSEEEILSSSNYSYKYCGFNTPELEPWLSSFNTPFGACNHCKGLGIMQKVDVDYLIPDCTKSTRQGGTTYYKDVVGTEDSEWQCFRALIDYYKTDTDKSIKDLKRSEPDVLPYGSKDLIPYRLASHSGNAMKKTEFIEGVCILIERCYMGTNSIMSRE